ncbi:MAG: hypothetical protein ACLGG7_07200 [Bacteriovoracia bacterium]
MKKALVQREANPILPSEAEEKKQVKAEIEERLNDTILACTLALKIVRNSDKPVGALMDELMTLEMNVGSFIGQALQTRPEELKTAARGALAGVFSTMSLDNQRTRNARIVTPLEQKQIPASPKKKPTRTTTKKSRRSRKAKKS